MTERKKGIISLILLSFVFASMGLFARYLSTGFELIQQVYLRVAAALLLGLTFFSKDINYEKFYSLPYKDWALIFLRAISFYVLGVTLFTQSILETKYSNVSFIGALPIVALLGFILVKEKITIQKVILVLLAFIGVLLISVKDYSNIFSWGYGETLALISCFFFSLSYVLRKFQTNILNNKELTVSIFSVALVLLFITSLIFGEGLPLNNWSFSMVLAVLGAGFFNVLNLFLTNYGFQKVESVLASNILTLESVFAIALGFIFFRETPEIKELIGGFLITTAIIFVNKIED